jgi:hypothetical protein
MPSREELKTRNSDSKSRQGATREIRGAQREAKDKMREALKGASSTKDRRAIKKAGIYDLDTQPNQDDNKEGQDERIQNDGIDHVDGQVDGGGGGGGVGGFNGSVLICIEGDPYWIDIAYDKDKGPYVGTEVPEFPIIP